MPFVQRVLQTARIFAAGFVSLVVLSVVAFFCNYSGVHVNNPSGATDCVWEPNQWKSTVTEGFSWVRMDESGYNNNAVWEDVDILLMGSSHMEAVNVAQKDQMGSLMNQYLPYYRTYNIGISGHTIYHCVNNLANAVQTYMPSKIIVMETSTVEMDEVKMQNVLDGTFTRIPSYDTGVVYWFQRNVPAVKSLYKSIENWKNVGQKEVENKLGNGVNEPKKTTATYYDTLVAFLSKASEDAGHRLMIFYHPKTSLNADGSYSDKTDASYLDMFASACEDAGIQFVNMTSEFQSLYLEEHILAHGFCNTAVGKGHLNKHGHRVIAKRLAKEIESD